ncbi:unnamed protein product [Arabis nemorensis]|uniref:Proteasome alpha-type subunits domain-containing protein n=1 Tax=Arabis nemorensis TaxID=586526 RepID=A0A565CTU3_9BRAS|nr:unnamed protein product [Arabis nemorensis]
MKFSGYQTLKSIKKIGPTDLWADSSQPAESVESSQRDTCDSWRLSRRINAVLRRDLPRACCRRLQVDIDVTTWSPTGRIRHGNSEARLCAIGLRSRNHVVLACVNKTQSEVSSHQRKIFKVDDYIGVAIAGLTVDGRVLSRYMRSDSINHSFTYESPLPVGRRVVHLADQAQIRCYRLFCLYR